MFNNNFKNKYLRYTNSDSADDENDIDITESENNSRNIDLIVNKLENKLNENNEFNVKMTSQNQETARTTKMNESNANNLSDLMQKNIKIKENDNSIDIGDSIYSVNSLPKSNKIGKSAIDIDISLNSNNLKELQKEEKEKNEIKNLNLIQILNNTNENSNNKNNNINMNRNNKNNYVSRNKILSTGSSLNTLSTQFDNSKYFLNKTNGNLILSNKIKKNNNENKNNNKKENNLDLNLKLTLNEEKKNKENELQTKNKNNSNLNNKKNNKCLEKFKCTFKKSNRVRRKCNYITLLRNICLTIIITSAFGFYILIFIY